MTDLAGQNIGRYHIIERLGFGGMATVYKAFDTRLERLVAIKVIRKEAVSPEFAEQILKRFEREAKSLAQLDHPFIVKVYDYGEHNGSPYLVMQYVPGGTLKQKLGKPIPWINAARLLIPIARALDYAHKTGIVHRDVKPANILITQTGDPMLSDFGIAKILEQTGSAALTATGVGIGTPEYMAPEQAVAHQVDHRADLYSLGIVFYEMVTGRKPFTADTPLAIILKHSTEPLPRPRSFVSDLPDEVELVLFKALAKKPEDRYPDMETFAQALEKLCVTLPLTGTPKPGTAVDEQTSTRIAATTIREPYKPPLPPPALAGVVAGIGHPGKIESAVPKNRRISPWLVVGGIALAGMILLGAAGVVVFAFTQLNLFKTATPIALASHTPKPSTTTPSDSTQPPITPTGTLENGETPTQGVIHVVPEICASDPYGCAKITLGQTIKIGMGAPMSGDIAAFGMDISQGASIAITDAGEFQGFKFELVVQDDGGTPEGGAAAANKLVSDKTVVAIAGHIFSSASLAALPIYEKAGIPMMSPSASSMALTQKGSDIFNRIAFTDATQGKFAAEYLYNKLGVRKLAVMHDGQAYGQGLAEVVRDTFKSLGGEVVAFEGIISGGSDYTTPLSSIAGKGPEAVYYGGYVAEAIVLANQMKKLGLEKALFFGCDGTYGQDFIDRTGANGEGAYAVALVPPDSAEKLKFDAAYQEKFGNPPGKLSPYTWNGYDAAAVLVAAVKRVAIRSGDTLYIPRGELIKAVRSTRDYQGLTGTITCDADGKTTGECNASGPIFYLVKQGKWVWAGNK